MVMMISRWHGFAVPQQVVFHVAAQPSGVYFARLEADGAVRTQKLLLVK